MNKQIKLAYFILVFIIICAGIFCYQTKYTYKNNCTKDREMRIQERIVLEFKDKASRLIRKHAGESSVDDFMDSMILKTYIEAAGINDPRYIVDKKICNLLKENNVTAIIYKDYIVYRRTVEHNQSITLKKSFYNGMKEISKMCEKLE